MPKTQYPLWWLPVVVLCGVPFILVGVPVVTLIVAFAFMNLAYAIGWAYGTRAIHIRLVEQIDPEKRFPPDDCPYEHRLDKMFTVEPGVEVRCNGCGILMGKGEQC